MSRRQPRPPVSQPASANAGEQSPPLARPRKHKGLLIASSVLFLAWWALLLWMAIRPGP